MLIEAALIIEMHRSNPAMDDKTAEAYAGWVVEESENHKLDPWLVYSLVHVESRWKTSAFRLEGDGTCSVGLGQINVPNCDPWTIERLHDPHHNLKTVTLRLDLLRRICRKKCEGIGFVRGYNPGDRSYLRLIGQVLERCHDDYEPALREVRTGMHVSRVWGAGPC